MPLGSNKILVCGGAGFIGSNYVHHIIDEFEEIHVLDKLTYAGDIENLTEVIDDINFVEADIRNRDCLNNLYEQVDYVVNFAAQSHVDRSIESGRTFAENNVVGAFTAMDLLRDHDIKRFLQISTDEVYGSIDQGAFDETDSLNPSSPYSASKASADLFVNAMWETYDLPITVARPTNIYGPRQHPEKLIPKFTLNALNSEKLPVYGDGGQVRQWLHVNDVSRAINLLLTKGKETFYNIPGPSKHSNIEVTKNILELTESSQNLIEYVEDRKGHDRRYALEGSKIRSDTGFEPSINFDEGLRQTVKWYQSNQNRYVKG